MRLRANSRFEWEGRLIQRGDELEVADTAARSLCANGLCDMADGSPLPAGLHYGIPETVQPDPAEYAKPLANPGKAPKRPRKAHKAGSVCAQPGCPEYVPDGGKCSAHRRVSSTTGKPYRSSQRKVPGGRRTTFARMSKAFLREHPTCEGEGCSAVNPLSRNPATETHHIDSLGLVGPRWDDKSNWLACCKSCHARYTGREFGFGA
jgi:hypothetical protein